MVSGMPRPSPGHRRLTPEGLHTRLTEFGVAVCGLLRDIPDDVIGAQLSRRLVRSAMSPVADYAEARRADARRDFVHKMRVGTRELRRTATWLQSVRRLGPYAVDANRLISGCDKLTAIFVASVKTALK